MPLKGITRRRARELRRSMTAPEIALWEALRSRRLSNRRFRRQHPIGPWIVDFYCAEYRLALEVDGEWHALERLDYDARRDQDLSQRGVRVIRFSARDVLREIDGVLATIEAELRA